MWYLDYLSVRWLFSLNWCFSFPIKRSTYVLCVIWSFLFPFFIIRFLVVLFFDSMTRRKAWFFSWSIYDKMRRNRMKPASPFRIYTQLVSFLTRETDSYSKIHSPFKNNFSLEKILLYCSRLSRERICGHSSQRVLIPLFQATSPHKNILFPFPISPWKIFGYTIFLTLVCRYFSGTWSFFMVGT